MNSTVAAVEPSFKTGVYSFPLAARLLKKNASTLRYWLDEGLVTPAFAHTPGQSQMLAFHDVISLALVRRFRDSGVSLHRVRQLEAQLRELYPNEARPFALRGFFTDGADVWHQIAGTEGNLVQMTGRNRRAMVWGEAIATFAREVIYDSRGLAEAWRLGHGVWTDPRVQFGAPVVEGTRILVMTLAENLKTASAEEVARWYDLDVVQVQAVEEYVRSA